LFLTEKNTTSKKRTFFSLTEKIHYFQKTVLLLQKNGTFFPTGKIQYYQKTGLFPQKMDLFPQKNGPLFLLGKPSNTQKKKVIKF